MYIRDEAESTAKTVTEILTCFLFYDEDIWNHHILFFKPAFQHMQLTSQ